jgi:hypothetical protein
MTRRATSIILVLCMLCFSAGCLTLSGIFGLIAYAAAVLHAERVAVFLFSCALAPMLLVGYVGAGVHDRLHHRRPAGRRAAHG